MCWCVKGVNGELVLGGISVGLICFFICFLFFLYFGVDSGVNRLGGR